MGWMERQAKKTIAKKKKEIEKTKLKLLTGLKEAMIEGGVNIYDDETKEEITIEKLKEKSIEELLDLYEETLNEWEKNTVI